MAVHAVYVVVPGDLETRTGGYGYDRQMVAGLRMRGWLVEVVSLPGTYPFPSDHDRGIAARALALIPDDALVLFDGLACGALPGEVGRERARLRVVAIVHHPLALETGLDSATAAALRASERTALAAVRGIVVTSPATVRPVQELAPLVPVAVVEPGTELASAAAGSGGGPVQMICVASVVPRKGHDTLVAALAGLAALEWRMVCVGSLERDVPFARTVVSACASGALRDRVQFTGELEGEPLEAAYRGSDLFVLPTHYEGYGMAVAEAIARAIPVVSTDTGAIADLVGRDAGILVRPGEIGELAAALRLVMEDRGLLQHLREGAARRRVALPSWPAACAQMEAALVRLTAQ